MLPRHDDTAALKLMVTAILLAATIVCSRAQFTFANDRADNYSSATWTNASDLGSGFGGWGFSDQSTSANMGSFIGNPTNSGINPSALGSAAFGLYSVNATAGYANRSRGFEVGMGIGDVFTFDWGMNWDAGNNSGAKGFDIRSGSTNLFTLVQSGTNAAVNFNNNINSTTGAAANSYGTNNMAVTLTRTASGYTFTMTSRNTGGLFTTNISTSATIDNFNLFTGNQNNADNQRNIFFDNFSITNSGVFSQGGSVTNANTFAGTGALSIGNNTAFALSGSGNNNYSGATTISNGSTLRFQGSGTSDFGSAISGGGAIVVSNGAGQVNLQANNSSFTGNVTVANGSLEVQSANALGPGGGTTTVQSGATLKLYGGGPGISYGAEALTLNGLGLAYGDVGGDAGALRSVGGGNNTWNGAITLGSNARINADAAGGAGSFTIAGSIAGGNNVLFVGTKSSATANMTISGAISGAGAVQDGTITSLFKDGASTLTLSGNNSFSGDTRISAGNLTVASGGTLGDGTTDVFIAAAGSLAVNNSATVASLREWGTTNGGTATIGSGATLTVSGNDWSGFMNSIGGVGNLVKSGTGTMNLYGAQSYTGTTTVSGGRLSTGVALASSGVTVNGGTFETTQANILGDTATVTVNSGTYSLGGDDTVGALSGAGGTLNLGTSRLTSSVASGSSTFSGVISGTGTTGGLTKSGSGTLVLAGNNTYTGTTVVSGGELRVNGNQTAANGALAVNAGATLSGSGTIGGATTISGIHNPGNSPGVQSFNNNLTYNSGSTVNWELIGNTTAGRGTSFDGIDLLGFSNLNFSGATSLNLVFNGAGSGVRWQDAFWGSNRSWLVYDLNGGVVQNFGNFTLLTQNWADSMTDSFNTLRPDAFFSVARTGEDIFLVYTVPEPSTWALLALGAGVLGHRLLKRKK